jgi:DNA polymerase I
VLGLPHLPRALKDACRDLAIRGGPFTEEERQVLILYCRTDVDLTARLFEKLWDFAGLEEPRAFSQALIDGRYMAAAARCYRNGLPVNLPAYRRLFHGAAQVRLGLIRDCSDRFPVHTPDGTFSYAMFGELLCANDLLDDWPLTPTGRLATSKEAFEEMAEAHSIARELHRHLTLLEQLMTLTLHLGGDGRVRVQLRPFGTKTGRNAPSGTGNLLSKSAAFRPLIQPPPGRAMSSLDWGAQELRIAARRSGDPGLQRIAALPDPYIGLASSVGLAEPTDTKATNPKARAIGKIMQLALMYGIGARSFGLKAGKSQSFARGLLEETRQALAQFFCWSDGIVARAMLGWPLTTPLGWTLRFREGTTAPAPDRTARNFLMQGTAADMMRLAMIRAIEEFARSSTMVSTSRRVLLRSRL